MIRLLSAKTLLATAVALGAVGAASTAQAHTDVAFSVGFVAPVAPAYVAPQPVYVQPEPVYVAPQVAYYDRYSRADWYEHQRREREWRWHHRHDAYRYGAWGDADHDGVPNRYDHAPYNPYRR